MKKYKKEKNKIIIKPKLKTIDDGESFSSKEKQSENDFIYGLDPSIENFIKTRLIQNNIKETLKRKNKSIDIKTEHVKNKEDILSSPKKVKKKVV